MKRLTECPQSSTRERHGWRASVVDAGTAGRRRAAIQVGADHTTLGAIVVSRGGTRIRPQTFECSGRRCMVIIVQKHGSRGNRSVELSELLAQSGQA